MCDSVELATFLNIFNVKKKESAFKDILWPELFGVVRIFRYVEFDRYYSRMNGFVAIAMLHSIQLPEHKKCKAEF